jgi:hypothetical protein
MYTSELFDIDHDGYLDLIVGFKEGATWIFSGDGKSFNTKEFSRIPEKVVKFGVILDYIFYDLDGDGQEEIVVVRTGDGKTHPNYTGWSIQIISYDGSVFSDATSLFIKPGDESDDYGPSIAWIEIEQIGGITYLCGRKDLNSIKFFRLEDDKLIKEKTPQNENGLCLYSDSIVGVVDNHNFTCRTSPYGGSSCLSFSNWDAGESVEVHFEGTIDLSYLLENSYCLEFAVKNTDPALEVGFVLVASDGEEHGYQFYANETKHNGEWELIRVPMSIIGTYSWDIVSNDFWRIISYIKIVGNECHGQDFYLDEIRIRKLLPED